MYKIIENKEIVPGVFNLEIESPIIAEKIKPSQFVIIMAKQRSERIPMAIYDKTKTTIKILYSLKGSSTQELSEIQDNLFSVTGPLGMPSRLLNDEYKDKNILLVGIGTGIAPIYFLAKTLSKTNKNIDILYLVDDDLFEEPLMLSRLERVSHLKVSFNFKDDIEKVKKYDVGVLAGRIKELEYATKVFEKRGIETYVYLSPLMLCGVGICGSCRLTVDNSTKFACIDGPEFEASVVNFNEVKNRMNIYKKEELSKIEVGVKDE